MKKILLLLLVIFSILISCKKDNLTVYEEKRFAEINVVATAYNGGWQLTLQPDGIAYIIPSGDIVERGTYHISGRKIKVKTDYHSYEFEILSHTRIKDTMYGVILELR